MINIKSILMSSLLSLFLLGASSCDDAFVFEKEGDCTPKVQFVFKKHRQALQSIPGREVDVFYSTVNTVHIFVYDAETGQLVLEKTEKTENLQSESDLNIGKGNERCFLPVDINPGKYRIVAWCGLDDTDNNNAFSLLDGSRASGYTHCSVKYSQTTGQPVNAEKYDAVYHGMVESVDVYLDPEDAQIIPVELTKNTNDITVWVQHNTTTFENGEYEVVYTDSNGAMKFEDNSMHNDTPLEYHPHTTSVLSTDTEYNGAEVKSGAMIAHLSTARLMANHKDAKLEIRRKNGDVVFSIPFIKYILQMQTLTNNEQYYLDCEDTYNCSFYLSGINETWMPSQIIINNWVVVPGQNDHL